MLVLTRKLGASITIDDTIHVTVLEVRGNQVRLGIEAPAEVRVRRSELSQDAAPSSPSAATTDAPAATITLSGLKSRWTRPARWYRGAICCELCGVTRGM